MSGFQETREFSAGLRCRYLLQIPETLPDARLAAVTLHGYGSNPAAQLRLTANSLGPEWIVASLQAPNQHYLSNPAEGKTGYNWGVGEHWRDAVDLHHSMVQHVLSELRARFGITSGSCLLTGFSQAVGLNYRFCGTHRGQVGGLAAICGGLPRDWDEDKYGEVDAAILHISRDEDEFYPVSAVSEFPRRLRIHAPDVEFHLIPGQHRYPSQARAIMRPWLERVFGSSTLGA
jgi:predicted esterase